MCMNSKRNALTNIERQRLRIHSAKNPGLTQQGLSKWFTQKFKKGMAQSQVHEILSDKYKHLDQFPATGTKRNRKRPFEAIESALYEFSKTVGSGHKLTNKDLIAQASAMWEEMVTLPQWKDVGPPRFSDGWLSKWRKYAENRKRKEGEECSGLITHLDARDIRPTSSVSRNFEATASCCSVQTTASIPAFCNVVSLTLCQEKSLNVEDFALFIPQTDRRTNRDNVKTDAHENYHQPAPLPVIPTQLRGRSEGSHQRSAHHRAFSKSKSTTTANINHSVSTRTVSKSDICTNIEFLTCQSVFNQLFQRSNIFTKCEIMQIFAPNLSEVEVALRKFHRNAKGKHPLWRKALAQAESAIDLLMNSRMFNVVPPDTRGNSNKLTRSEGLKSHRLTVSGKSLVLKGGRADIICVSPYSLGSGKSSVHSQACKLPDIKILLTCSSKRRLTPQVIFHILESEWTSTSVMPTISFRNLIPKDSEIFRIALKGTVPELQKALEQGMGYVNDYDGERSLFGYAIEGENMAVLEFLLPYVDINAYEEESPRTLFARFEYQYIYSQRRKLQQLNEVFTVQQHDRMCRMMLDNGADLTLPEYLGESWPVLERTLLLWTWSLELVQFAMESEAAIVGDTIPFPGMSLATYCLLEFCRSSFLCTIGYEDPSRIPDLLTCFLKNGADIQARHWLGRTCLHLALHRDMESSPEIPMDGLGRWLSILLAAGADPFAVDDNRLSVSSYASIYGLEALWKDVLADFGYTSLQITDELGQCS